MGRGVLQENWSKCDLGICERLQAVDSACGGLGGLTEVIKLIGKCTATSCELATIDGEEAAEHSIEFAYPTLSRSGGQ